MALYNKLGLSYDALICEDTALPNATSAALTNDVEIQSKYAGNLRVLICAASTQVELAGGASLTFRPYVADTVANLTASPTILPATIITQAVQSDATWAIGEPICELLIPRSIIPSTAKYLRIMAVTSADESADKVEAFLIAD